jgi:hypothetical protein
MYTDRAVTMAPVEPEVTALGKSMFAGPLAVCAQQDEPEAQGRVSRGESYEGRFGEPGQFRKNRADGYGYTYGRERRPPPGQERALLAWWVRRVGSAKTASPVLGRKSVPSLSADPDPDETGGPPGPGGVTGLPPVADGLLSSGASNQP